MYEYIGVFAERQVITMENRDVKHIHFMGICGSGCASIAMLAHAAGYRVTGCDQSVESYYAQELRKLGIQISLGHSEEHLTEDVDIVAVSPAIFDISPDNAELKEAERRGILMTWQEFMGRFLQDGKRVIAISGTHGKTTTTFLTGELLIDAGLDPIVEGGSVYKKWGNGGRFGHSNLFVCEADEFNRNFHHYHPEIAVMNNVEMDHPECYNSYEEVIESFTHFVTEGGKLKTLILNGDSEGAMEVLKRAVERKLSATKAEPEKKPEDATGSSILGEAVTESVKNFEGTVRVYAFTRDENKDFSDVGYPVTKVFYRTEKKEVAGTTFMMEYEGNVHRFFMKLYGEYNVSNAVVATLITRLSGVDDGTIQESLEKFSGVGRRFDRVGEMRGVPVFDDYAHHPTEISSVLGMVKDYFPDKKLVAVFEPHQVSRLRLMKQDYADALLIADKIIIAKTHLGREIHKNVVPISETEWKEISDKFEYEEDNERIKAIIDSLISAGQCDIIVVIGAANSYKISRLLCESN